jgi:tripartite-type tricarboxylate transporter receptor subunit TctC
LLQSILGTRWIFVSYRGANPVMQALLAGEIDWAFTTPDQALAQAGHIKPYAIAAKSRLALVTDIPTTDEAGLPGYHLSYWLDFGRPRARQRRSSQRSTVPLLRPWPSRSFVSG